MIWRAIAVTGFVAVCYACLVEPEATRAWVAHAMADARNRR